MGIAFGRIEGKADDSFAAANNGSDHGDRRRRFNAKLNSVSGRLSRSSQQLSRSLSAHAARAVPEWQMRQVRGDINRYLEIVRVGEIRRDMQIKG